LLLQQGLDGVALGATFAKAMYSTRKYFWFAAAFVLVRRCPPYQFLPLKLPYVAAAL